MKNATIILFCFWMLSCAERKQVVTSFVDYKNYLTINQVGSREALRTEVDFWSHRLNQNKNDETSLLKLGALYAELFKATGSIENILVSDSLYNISLKSYPSGNVDIYHGLASNAMAQHKFQNAMQFAEKALALKDKMATSLLLVADASLEVGNYANSREILRQFKNQNSFSYLIRKAKLHDHEGMLDSAIISMEKAFLRVKGNKPLAQWTLSNLGDMYGHAGRVQDSYKAYLQVLQKSPNDHYAMKGIAWIALSYDGNTNDAKHIINALMKRNPMPDLHLMLAEIAEMENDELEKSNQLKKFKKLVERPGYRQMFHKYLAILAAEEFNDAEEAIKIAREEIAERPCPQSYDLLAWGYFHQKKFNEALEIASRRVENQTFEPESLFHLGMIYQANGLEEKARYYFAQALKSEFELGPSISKRIKAVIKNL